MNPTDMPTFEALCAKCPDSMKADMPPNYVSQMQYTHDTYESGEIVFAMFKLACEYNQLEMAKWLYSNYNLLDIPMCDELMANACGEGHIELFKWMYDAFPGHVDKYYLLKVACEDAASGRRSLEICKFIADSTNFAFNGSFSGIATKSSAAASSRITEMFYDLCKKASLQIIKWFAKRFYLMRALPEPFTLFCIVCNPDIAVLKWYIKTVKLNVARLSGTERRYIAKLIMRNGVKYAQRVIYLLNLAPKDMPREYRQLFKYAIRWTTQVYYPVMYILL
jgi:hypothetical protein